MSNPAVLVLEDGSVFRGESIGAPGASVGEVVFNTAMTGYQEILTDPSYLRQLVTLTYPHIGNTGANPEDEESAGYPGGGAHHPRPAAPAEQLAVPGDPARAYLLRQGVVAIAGIDTRRLTRVLREKGAQNGCLAGRSRRWTRPQALAAARAFPGLMGMDLAQEASTREPYTWTQGIWDLDQGLPAPRDPVDLPVSRRCLRLRHQAQHPAHAGGPGLPGDRGPGPHPGRRGPGPGPGRGLPVQRPG